jgi:hypothetical protein
MHIDGVTPMVIGLVVDFLQDLNHIQVRHDAMVTTTRTGLFPASHEC